MAAAIKAETTPFRHAGVSEQPTWVRYGHAEQVRSGGIEFFTGCRPDLATLCRRRRSTASVLRSRTIPRSGRPWTAISAPMCAARSTSPGRGHGEIWDNGFRQTTSSSKAITARTIFKGLQDRVPVSRCDLDVQGVRRLARLDQFQRSVFGAADQDRRGQENPLALISTAKLYEVQKYCRDHHMWTASGS